MKKIIFLLLILVCFANIISAQQNNFGDLKLHNIYEGDTEASKSFFLTLNFNEAFGAFNYINKELNNYMKLSKDLNKENLEKNIAIGNNLDIIKLTLLKQEYIIKKLEYEMSMNSKNKLPQNNIDEKKKSYIEAKEKFEKEYNSISKGE
jgi:hypothetical protein